MEPMQRNIHAHRSHPLAIAELVLEVVSLSRRKDLLSLALVCKGSKLPALYVLWQHLGSPSPWFSLVPAFAPTSSAKWALVRPPTEAEWLLLDRYAGVIRSFHSLFSSNPLRPHKIDIDPLIFDQLQACRPRSPLFPQMRSVTVPAIGGRLLKEISAILSPLIEHATLSITDPACSYVEELFKNSSQLKRLCLSGQISSSSLLVLSKFSDIEHLSLDFAHKVTLNVHECQQAALQSTHLPPSLKSLELRSVDHFEFTFLSILSPRSSLTRLYISASSSFIARNLKVTSGLRDVTLEFTDAVMVEDDVVSAFQALKVGSADTLTHIEFTSLGSDLFQKLIHPLLDFPHIESFVMHEHEPHNLDVDAQCLETIVNSWPQLDRFILPVWWGGVNVLAPADLRILARLPNLRCLLLPIGLGTHIGELPLCSAPSSLASHMSLVDYYLTHYFPDGLPQ
ncbi:hypothetical protein NLJ89_g11071 [Agrocybe chaxingu]|uniref:F-box domain-containing protein n=1 Tax=Agrocybe chaxingu TaxID=84603 RepID=A0A9W8JPZ0_9AGAR|nr:hypothetical protein NLJ89_g11071 [Agrocybe chaxingu]